MPSRSHLGNKTITYQIQVIDTPSRLEGFISQWNNFVKTSNNIHFYQDIERLRLSESTNQNTHGFRIIVLLLDKEIHCIAPLIREPNRFPIKFGIFTLAAVSCLRYKLPAGKLLFSKHADRRQCIKKLLSLPRSNINGINCLFIEEMLLSDARVLSKHMKGYRLRQLNLPAQGTWRLEINGAFDEYFMRLSSKKRSEMRRRVRKLDAATNSWRIKCIDKPHDVAELKSAQAFVYSRCWKASGLDQLRTGLGQEYLKETALRSWLRGYVLYCDEKPCAYSINFQYRGIFYGQEIAYDKNRKNLNLGTILIQETIKDLYQKNPPKIMDFGFGDNQQKRLFCTDSRLASSTYLVRRFTLASVLIELQFWLSKLYRQCYQLLSLINLDKKIKRKYK